MTLPADVQARIDVAERFLRELERTDWPEMLEIVDHSQEPYYSAMAAVHAALPLAARGIGDFALGIYPRLRERTGSAFVELAEAAAIALLVRHQAREGGSGYEMETETLLRPFSRIMSIGKLEQ